jgi:uncharacterized protein
MVDPTIRSKLEDEARSRCVAADPAHDFLHVQRVSAMAERIARAEGADVDVCTTAALLHELFNYPKDHPESHRSGEVCAAHAAELMERVGCPPAQIQAVRHCIHVHGFSAGLTPETLEAKVLQDADRLDAIGAIGIARCFATCASMKRPFYSADDPFCRTRPTDDKQFGVDHFYRKLLLIPDRLHTQTARALGARRRDTMQAYLRELEGEIVP